MPITVENNLRPIVQGPPMIFNNCIRQIRINNKFDEIYGRCKAEADIPATGNYTTTETTEQSITEAPTFPSTEKTTEASTESQTNSSSEETHTEAQTNPPTESPTEPANEVETGTAIEVTSEDTTTGWYLQNN